MLSRDRAQPKTLWRLLLAAVQVACVLAWASMATAEELPAPAESVASSSWAAATDGTGGVHLAGRVVGMCGTAGQSIAAPPPIYPGSDATARPCTPPGEELRVGAPLLPRDAPATIDLQPDKSAVLPPSVLLPRRLTLPARPARLLDSPGEEHRARALRPPQA